MNNEQVGVRETLCTRCVHREVCKYKEDFLQRLSNVGQEEFTPIHTTLECKAYKKIEESTIIRVSGEKDPA